MQVKIASLHELHYISTKNIKVDSQYSSEWLQKITPISENLEVRNNCIEWMYRAQRYLTFSRSTLFLAIGILDKLVLDGFKLTIDKYQLFSASLIHISCKFNEVHPPSLRRLNSMLIKDQNHDRNSYLQMEGLILSFLNFDLIQKQKIYEELVEIESIQESQQKTIQCQQIIKTALLHPQIAFKHGSKILLMAINSFLNGAGLSIRMNQNKTLLYASEIRFQLSKLREKRKHNLKRFVSPKKV